MQIYSTITSKGQVTIPAEIRKRLGVDTNDKVVFQVNSQGEILLTTPPYRSLVDLKGSAGKLPYPLTEKESKEIIAEERAEAAMKNG
jgi:antitoxin PrlF